MAKIHDAGNGHFRFRCPGCNETHDVRVGTDGWTWNGDVDAPTFAPSVLARSGHYIPGSGKSCWCTYAVEHPDDPAPFHCYQCHSFVRDGRIEFLGDCSHALAGQTVELPEWISSATPS